VRLLRKTEEDYYFFAMCSRIFINKIFPQIFREEVQTVAKGTVYNILQDVYQARCFGEMDLVRQRIIRVQISLKTGLNLRDYTPETEDSEEDIQRILDIVRGPGIGLRDYEYKKGGIA
jgi:hypothetical protein